MVCMEKDIEQVTDVSSIQMERGTGKTRDRERESRYTSGLNLRAVWPQIHSAPLVLEMRALVRVVVA